MDDEEKKKKLLAGKEKLLAFQKKKLKRKKKKKAGADEDGNVSDYSQFSETSSLADMSDFSDVNSVTYESDQGSIMDEDSLEENVPRRSKSSVSRADLKKAVDRITELEEHLLGKQTALDSLIEENDQLRAQLAGQQAGQASNESSISTPDLSDLSSVTSKEGTPEVMEVYQQKISELQSALHQRDEVISQLSANLTATTESRDSMQQEYTAQASQLASQVQTLQLQLQQAGEYLRNVGEQGIPAQALLEAKNELLALQQANKEKQNEVSILQAAVKQRDVALQQMVEQYKVLNEQIVILSQQSATYHQQEAEHKETIIKLTSRIKEIEVLEKEIVILRENSQVAVKGSGESATAQLEALIKEKEQELTSLRETIQQKDLCLQQMALKFNENTQEIKLLMEENTALKKRDPEWTSLQASLAAKDDQLRLKEEELLRLRGALLVQTEVKQHTPAPRSIPDFSAIHSDAQSMKNVLEEMANELQMYYKTIEEKQQSLLVVTHHLDQARVENIKLTEELSVLSQTSSRFSKLEQDLLEKENMVAKLQEAVGAKDQSLAALSAKMHHVAHEKEELIGRDIEQYKQSMQQKEHSLLEVSGQLEQSRREVVTLSEEITVLRTQTSKYSQLEQTLHESEVSVARLQEAVKARDKSLEALLSKQSGEDDLARQFAGSQESVVKLEQRLAEKDGELVTLQGELARKDLSLQTLQNQVSELSQMSSQCEELKKKVHLDQEALRAANQSLESIQSLLQTQETEILSLRHSLQQKEQDINMLQGTLSEKTRVIEENKNALSEKEHLLQETTGKLQVTSNENVNLCEEIKVLKETRNEYLQLQQIVQKKDHEIEHYSKVLLQKDESLAQMTQTMTLAMEKSSQSTEISELLEARESQVQDLTSQLQKEQLKVLHLQETVSQREQSLLQISEKLSETAQENASLMDEVKLLKQYQNELAQAQEALRKREANVLELTEALTLKEKAFEEVNQLLAKSSSTSEMLEELRLSLSQRNEELQSVRQDLTKKEKVVSNLNEDLTVKDQALKVMSEKAESVEKVLSENARVALEEKDTEIKVLMGKVSALENIVCEKDKSLDDLTQKLSASENQVQEISGDLITLKEQEAIVSNLQDNLAKKDLELCHLAESVTLKEGLLQQLSQTLASAKVNGASPDMDQSIVPMSDSDIVSDLDCVLTSLKSALSLKEVELQQLNESLVVKETHLTQISEQLLLSQTEQSSVDLPSALRPEGNCVDTAVSLEVDNQLTLVSEDGNLPSAKAAVSGGETLSVGETTPSVGQENDVEGVKLGDSRGDEILALKQIIESLEGELTTVKQAVVDKDISLTQLSEQLEELLGTVAEKEGIEEQNEALQSRVRELEAELIQQQTLVVQHEKNLTEANLQLDEAQQKVQQQAEAASSQMIELQGIIQEKEEEVTALFEASREKEQDVHNISHQLTKVQQSRAQEEDILAVQNQEIELLRNKLNAMEAESNTLRDALSVKESEVQQLSYRFEQAVVQSVPPKDKDAVEKVDKCDTETQTGDDHMSANKDNSNVLNADENITLDSLKIALVEKERELDDVRQAFLEKEQSLEDLTIQLNLSSENYRGELEKRETLEKTLEERELELHDLKTVVDGEEKSVAEQEVSSPPPDADRESVAEQEVSSPPPDADREASLRNEIDRLQKENEWIKTGCNYKDVVYLQDTLRRKDEEIENLWFSLKVKEDKLGDFTSKYNEAVELLSLYEAEDSQHRVVVSQEALGKSGQIKETAHEEAVGPVVEDTEPTVVTDDQLSTLQKELMQKEHDILSYQNAVQQLHVAVEQQQQYIQQLHQQYSEAVSENAKLKERAVSTEDAVQDVSLCVEGMSSQSPSSPDGLTPQFTDNVVSEEGEADGLVNKDLDLIQNAEHMSQEQLSADVEVMPGGQAVVESEIPLNKLSNIACKTGEMRSLPEDIAVEKSDLEQNTCPEADTVKEDGAKESEPSIHSLSKALQQKEQDIQAFKVAVQQQQDYIHQLLQKYTEVAAENASLKEVSQMAAGDHVSEKAETDELDFNSTKVEEVQQDSYLCVEPSDVSVTDAVPENEPVNSLIGVATGIDCADVSSEHKIPEEDMSNMQQVGNNYEIQEGESSEMVDKGINKSELVTKELKEVEEELLAYKSACQQQQEYIHQLHQKYTEAVNEITTLKGQVQVDGASITTVATMTESVSEIKVSQSGDDKLEGHSISSVTSELADSVGEEVNKPTLGEEADAGPPVDTEVPSPLSKDLHQVDKATMDDAKPGENEQDKVSTVGAALEEQGYLSEQSNVVQEVFTGADAPAETIEEVSLKMEPPSERLMEPPKVPIIQSISSIESTGLGNSENSDAQTNPSTLEETLEQRKEELVTYHSAVQELNVVVQQQQDYIKQLYTQYVNVATYSSNLKAEVDRLKSRSEGSYGGPLDVIMKDYRALQETEQQRLDLIECLKQDLSKRPSLNEYESLKQREKETSAVVKQLMLDVENLQKGGAQRSTITGSGGLSESHVKMKLDFLQAELEELHGQQIVEMKHQLYEQQALQMNSIKKELKEVVEERAQLAHNLLEMQTINTALMQQIQFIKGTVQPDVLVGDSVKEVAASAVGSELEDLPLEEQISTPEAGLQKPSEVVSTDKEDTSSEKHGELLHTQQQLDEMWFQNQNLQKQIMDLQAMNEQLRENSNLESSRVSGEFDIGDSSELSVASSRAVDGDIITISSVPVVTGHSEMEEKVQMLYEELARTLEEKKALTAQVEQMQKATAMDKYDMAVGPESAEYVDQSPEITTNDIQHNQADKAGLELLVNQLSDQVEVQHREKAVLHRSIAELNMANHELQKSFAQQAEMSFIVKQRSAEKNQTATEGVSHTETDESKVLQQMGEIQHAFQALQTYVGAQAETIHELHKVKADSQGILQQHLGELGSEQDQVSPEEKQLSDSAHPEDEVYQEEAEMDIAPDQLADGHDLVSELRLVQKERDFLLKEIGELKTLNSGLDESMVQVQEPGVHIGETVEITSETDEKKALMKRVEVMQRLIDHLRSTQAQETEKVQKLVETTANQEKETENIWTELNSVQLEKSILSEQLEHSSAERLELQSQVAVYAEQIQDFHSLEEELKAQLGVVQQKREELLGQISELQSENDNLKANMEKTRQHAEDLETIKDGTSASLQRLSEDLKSMQKERENLLDKLADQESQITNLQTNLDEAIQSKELIGNENESLARKVENLEMQTKVLESNVGEALHGKDVLQAENTRMEDCVKQLEDKLTSVEEVRESLEKERSQLLISSESLVSEKIDLAARLDEVLVSNTLLNEELEKEKGKVQETVETLKSAEREKSSLLRSKEELESQIIALKQSLEQAISNLPEKEMVQRLADEADCVRKEKEVLVRSLDEMRDSASQQAEESKSIQQKITSDIEQLTEELGQAVEEKSKLQVNIDELKLKLCNLQENMQLLNTSLEESQQANHDVESKLDQTSSELEVTHKRKQELENTLEDLKTENQQGKDKLFMQMSSLEEIMGDNQKMQAELQSLSLEFEKVKVVEKELRNEVEILSNDLKHTISDKKDAERKFATTSENLETSVLEKYALQRQLEESVSNTNEEKKKIETVSQELQEAHEENIHLKKRVKELSYELQCDQEMLASGGSRMNLLSSELNEVHEEKTSLESKVEELSSDLFEAQDAQENMHEKVESLSAQLDESRQHNADFTAKVESLVTELKLAQEQNEILSADNKAVSEQLIQVQSVKESLVTELKLAQEQNETLSADNKTVSEQLIQVQSVKESLVTELKLAQEQNETLSADNKTVSEQLLQVQSVKDDLEQKAQTQDEELKEALNGNVELKARIEHFAKIEDSQVELQKKVDDLESLNNDLTQQMENYCSIQEETQQLHSKVAKLENIEEQLRKEVDRSKEESEMLKTESKKMEQKKDKQYNKLCLEVNEFKEQLQKTEAEKRDVMKQLEEAKAADSKLRTDLSDREHMNTQVQERSGEQVLEMQTQLEQVQVQKVNLASGDLLQAQNLDLSHELEQGAVGLESASGVAPLMSGGRASTSVGGGSMLAKGHLETSMQDIEQLAALVNELQVANTDLQHQLLEKAGVSFPPEGLTTEAKLRLVGLSVDLALKEKAELVQQVEELTAHNVNLSRVSNQWEEASVRQDSVSSVDVTQTSDAGARQDLGSLMKQNSEMSRQLDELRSVNADLLNINGQLTKSLAEHGQWDQGSDSTQGDFDWENDDRPKPSKLLRLILEDKTKQIVNLQASNTELQRTMKEQIKFTRQVEEARFREERLTLTRQMEEMQTKYNEFQEEKQHLLRKVKDWENRYEILRQKSAMAAGTTVNEIDTLRAENKEFMEKLAQLSVKIENATKEKDELARQLEIATADLHEFHTRNPDMVSYRKKIEDLNDTLKVTWIENEQLKQQIMVLKGEFTEGLQLPGTEQSSGSVKENNNAAASKPDRNAPSQEEADVVLLSAQVEKLQGEKVDLNAKYAQEIEVLQNKLALETKVLQNDKEESVKELTSHVQEVEMKYQHLESELCQVRKDREEMEAEYLKALVDLKEEHDILLQQCECQHREDLAQLRQHMDVVVSEQLSAGALYEKQLEELKRRLILEEEERETMRQQHEGDLKRLVTELENKEMERKELEVNIASLRNRSKSLDAKDIEVNTVDEGENSIDDVVARYESQLQQMKARHEASMEANEYSLQEKYEVWKRELQAENKYDMEEKLKKQNADFVRQFKQQEQQLQKAFNQKFVVELRKARKELAARQTEELEKLQLKYEVGSAHQTVGESEKKLEDMVLKLRQDNQELAEARDALLKQLDTSHSQEEAASEEVPASNDDTQNTSSDTETRARHFSEDSLNGQDNFGSQRSPVGSLELQVVQEDYTDEEWKIKYDTLLNENLELQRQLEKQTRLDNVPCDSLEDVSNIPGGVQSEVDMLKRENRELQSSLDKQNLEVVESLQNELSDVQGKYEQLWREHASLVSQLGGDDYSDRIRADSLEEDGYLEEGHFDENDKDESPPTSMRPRLASPGSRDGLEDYGDYKVKLEALRKENQALRSRLRTLGGSDRIIEPEFMQDLHAKYDSIAEENEVLRAKLGRYGLPTEGLPEEEHMDLVSKYEAIRRENDQLRGKLDAYERGRREDRDEDWKAKYDGILMEYESIKSQLSDSDILADDKVQKGLEDLQVQYDSVVKEKEQLLYKLDTVQENATKEMADLQAMLSASQAENEEYKALLNKSKDKTKRDYTKLKAKYNVASKELKEVKSQLETYVSSDGQAATRGNAESNSGDHQDELNALKEKCSSMAEENESLKTEMGVLKARLMDSLRSKLRDPPLAHSTPQGAQLSHSSSGPAEVHVPADPSDIPEDLPILKALYVDARNEIVRLQGELDTLHGESLNQLMEHKADSEPVLSSAQDMSNIEKAQSEVSKGLPEKVTEEVINEKRTKKRKRGKRGRGPGVGRSPDGAQSEHVETTTTSITPTPDETVKDSVNVLEEEYQVLLHNHQALIQKGVSSEVVGHYLILVKKHEELMKTLHLEKDETHKRLVDLQSSFSHLSEENKTLKYNMSERVSKDTPVKHSEYRDIDTRKETEFSVENPVRHESQEGIEVDRHPVSLDTKHVSGLSSVSVSNRELSSMHADKISSSYTAKLHPGNQGSFELEQEWEVLGENHVDRSNVTMIGDRSKTFEGGIVPEEEASRKQGSSSCGSPIKQHHGEAGYGHDHGDGVRCRTCEIVKQSVDHVRQVLHQACELQPDESATAPRSPTHDGGKYSTETESSVEEFQLPEFSVHLTNIKCDTCAVVWHAIEEVKKVLTGMKSSQHKSLQLIEENHRLRRHLNIVIQIRTAVACLKESKPEAHMHLMELLPGYVREQLLQPTEVPNSETDHPDDVFGGENESTIHGEVCDPVNKSELMHAQDEYSTAEDVGGEFESNFEEVMELKQTIAWLQSENKNLIQENDELMAKLESHVAKSAFEKVVQQTESEGKSSEVRMKENQGRNEMQTLQESYANLEEVNTKISQENEKLREYNSKILTDFEQLKIQYETLYREKEQTEMDLGHQMQECHELKDQVQKLNTSSHTIDEALERGNTQLAIDTLEDRKKDVEKRNEELCKENEKLHIALEDLEQESKRLIESLHSEKVDLENQNQHLIEKIDKDALEVGNQLLELQRSYDQLADDNAVTVDEFKTYRDKHEKEMANLKARYEDTVKDNEFMHSQLMATKESADREMAHIQSINEELQREYEELQGQHNAEKEKLGRDYEELKTSMESLQKEHEDMKGELYRAEENVDSKVDVLQKRCKDLDDENRLLKRDFEELHNRFVQLEKVKEDGEKQYGELSEKYSSLSKYVEQIKEKLDLENKNLSEKLQEVETEYQELAFINEELKSAKTSISQDLEDSQLCCEVLERSGAELRDENKSLQEELEQLNKEFESMMKAKGELVDVESEDAIESKDGQQIVKVSKESASESQLRRQERMKKQGPNVAKGVIAEDGDAEESLIEVAEQMGQVPIFSRTLGNWREAYFSLQEKYSSILKENEELHAKLISANISGSSIDSEYTELVEQNAILRRTKTKVEHELMSQKIDQMEIQAAFTELVLLKEEKTKLEEELDKCNKNFHQEREMLQQKIAENQIQLDKTLESKQKLQDDLCTQRERYDKQLSEVRSESLKGLEGNEKSKIMGQISSAEKEVGVLQQKVRSQLDEKNFLELQVSHLKKECELYERHVRDLEKEVERQASQLREAAREHKEMIKVLAETRLELELGRETQQHNVSRIEDAVHRIEAQFSGRSTPLNTSRSVCSLQSFDEESRARSDPSLDEAVQRAYNERLSEDMGHMPQDFLPARSQPGDRFEDPPGPRLSSTRESESGDFSPEVTALKQKISVLEECNKNLKEDKEELQQRLREQEELVLAFQRQLQDQDCEKNYEELFGQQIQLLITEKERLCRKLDEEREKERKLTVFSKEKVIIQEQTTKEIEMFRQKLQDKEAAIIELLRERLALERHIREQQRLYELLQTKLRLEQEMQQQQHMLESELGELQRAIHDKDTVLRAERVQLLGELRLRNVTMQRLSVLQSQPNLEHTSVVSLPGPSVEVVSQSYSRSSTTSSVVERLSESELSGSSGAEGGEENISRLEKMKGAVEDRYKEAINRLRKELTDQAPGQATVTRKFSPR